MGFLDKLLGRFRRKGAGREPEPRRRAADVEVAPSARLLRRLTSVRSERELMQLLAEHPELLPVVEEAMRQTGKPAPRLSPIIEPGAEARAELAHLPPDTKQTLFHLAQATGDPRLEPERLRLLEHALKVVDRRVSPHLWATLHGDFGTALYKTSLGDRAENVERAIGVFQAALQVFTRHRFPVQWAMIQNNLGEAWRERPRGDRADNLERAIDAYSGSLGVLTRDGYPAHWASVQNNLGIAYAGRVSGDREENVATAMRAFERALEVRTREDFPADWAQTQYNLGNLCAGAVHGDRAQCVEQAITAYRAALEVFTEADFPRQRASTRAALEEVLRQRAGAHMPESRLEVEFARASPAVHEIVDQLAQIEGYASPAGLTWRVELLERGLACVDESGSPHLWAKFQADLGRTLQSPILGDRARNLERAIAALTAALGVGTRDESPVHWARTQVSLGNAYVERVRGDRAENLERAIAAFSAALQVYTRDRFPAEWATAQSNLGAAYVTRIRGDRVQNVERAIDSLQAALSACARHDSPVSWARIQGNLGATYAERVRGNRSENLERAIQACTAALEVYTRTGHPFEWATAMQNLSVCYSERVRGNRADNLEQALALATDALQVYTRTDFPMKWAAIHANLGGVYQSRVKGDRAQNLERAIDALHGAQKVYTRDDFPLEWAKIQLNLGSAYEYRIQGDRTENLEKSIDASTAALQVYTRDGFPVEWATLQNNLGNALRHRIEGDRAENLERAIGALQAALEVYTRHDFPEDWARAQNNLGTIYSQRIRGDRAENLERAIGAFIAAMEVRTREDFPRRWAMTQANLGVVYKDRIRGERAPNVERAVDAFQAALEVYTRDDFPERWATVHVNLGNAYSQRIHGDRADNLERAIDAFSVALEVLTRDDFPTYWTQAQVNLGNAYMIRLRGNRAENLELAMAAYSAAMVGARQLGVKEYERGAAFHLGFLHYEEQRWSDAYAAFDTAIAALEGMRALRFSQAGKVHLAEQNAELYTGMVDACLRLGHVREALERAEAGKGRSFLDQLSSGPFPRPSLPPGRRSLLDRESDLIAELRSLENVILNVDDEARRREWVARQEERRTALDRVWAQLEPLAPEYVAMRRGVPIEYERLQALVDGPGVAAALLEFYSLPDRVVVFVVRSGEREPLAVEAPISQKRLAHHLKNYTREIWGYRRRGDIGENWQELAKPLLGEALSYLEGAELVHLVPHGSLHHFPIHALRVDGEYLVDRFAIVYAPSAGALDRVTRRARKQKPPGKQRRALVLGYTPYEDERAVFEGEAVQVAEFFGTGPRLGPDATGALLREQGAQYNVLHLSCHGSFDSTDPLASGLRLADGILTARDIMGIDLDADLVTLSACQTGRSQVGSGDELVGLTRALLYAGASSVLVTLWSVDAVAALELMEDFYTRLRGAGRLDVRVQAIALRDTMLNMREAKPHPYYWAPFVLVGGCE